MLLPLLAFLALGAGMPSAAFAASSITGTVTDASTGTGISGITVQAEQTTQGNVVATAITAADGTYTLAVPDAVNYHVEFDPGSTADFGDQFYSDKASFATANLVTVAGTAATPNIDAALVPSSGHVTGTVTDGSGTPLTGIQVQALDGEGNPAGNAVTTAANGTYTLTALPTGSYEIRFDGAGQNFVTQYYNGKSGFSSADTVSVTTGTTTPNVNATMATGGQITGTVTDASTGAPLQAATVSNLGCLNQGGINCTTTTDAAGQYTLTGLGTGNYYLFFEGPSGQNYISVYSGGSTNVGQASAVGVTAGSTAAANAALPVGGQISGTITNSSTGAPVQGVGVAVFDSNGEIFGQTDTAADGTYTVNGLASGTYVVSLAGSSGSPPLVDEFYNGTSSLATATPVSVTQGQTTTASAGVPPASAGGRISGTVVGRNGAPISGVSVTVYDTAGNLVAISRPTDIDGSYRTAALLPGSYKIGFTASAGNLAFQYFNAKSTIASADVVSVAAGGTTPGVNATLGIGGTMTGTVSDAGTHRALGGITVSLVDTTGAVLDTAFTLPDGTYTMTGIPSGSYHVQFNPNGASLPGGALYAQQYYSNKATLASSDAVGITAGATTPNINAGLVSLAAVATPVTVVPGPAPAPKPTPTPVAGKPKTSGGSLSGIGKRKATLKFKLAAGSNGAPKLKSFKVKLPKGLSFAKKGLKKGLTVTGGGKYSDKISKGVLIVTLKKTAAKVSVSLTSKAVLVSKSLAKSAKRHKIKSLVVTVTVTDAKKKNTVDKLTFKKPH